MIPDGLPDFPDLVDLGLEHKPILDALLRDLQPKTSELTFTNLYIWRHVYGLKLARMGAAVCLFSMRADPEDSFLLPPLGDGAGVEHVRRGLDFLAEQGHAARLARIDQEGMTRLGLTRRREASHEGFDIQPDRDNFDYVYRVPDLIDLAGDAYRDKRQHFQAFARKYKYEYRPITDDLVDGCLFVQDLWCDEKHCDLHSSLRAERQAVHEVLRNRDALGVVGGALVVNNRVQAFSLGEMLNDNTAVIHIEKASPELHGSFAAINREFLANAWADVPFVNREQDVGDPGLRHSKESYQPAMMIEKFIVRA